MLGNPCLEAAFALSNYYTDLKLYDCLIPKIQESQWMEKYVQAINESEEVNAKLKIENCEMKEQVKQFKEELEILNWYIQVLEDGKSSKGLFEKNI